MMADEGFPLTFDFLHRIAQAIINDRAPPNNEYDIGRHWVRRFLDRHPTLNQRYIAYQERVRKSAARKNIRQLFYRDLANLACRKGVTPDNIWNCDEKGITMGRGGQKEKAIVHVGKKTLCP